MKNLLTFEQFINESYGSTIIDSDDKDLIECLRELYSQHLEENNYTDSDFEIMYEFINHVENSGIELFEDEAGDVDKAIDKQVATKGKQSLTDFTGLLGWVFFTPYKAAYELIKIAQKKKEAKALLSKVPEGKKKEALRDKLNSMRRDEVRAIAQIKSQQSMKKSATKKEGSGSAKGSAKESALDAFSSYLDLYESKGKITAAQKEKIIDQAKDQGAAKGEQIASKAKALDAKVKEMEPEKKKETIDKLKATADKNKKEWETVKKKAEEAGVKL
jgi:hypothetical protein